MQACTAGYVLTNVTTPESSVTWTVVRLTAAKFQPLVFSMNGFSLSNATHIRIRVVVSKSWFQGPWGSHVRPQRKHFLGSDPIENTVLQLMQQSLLRACALPSNGCKQRFHCWLLTYSVHVTLLSWRSWNTALAGAWRDWGNIRNTLVRIACVQAEISIEHFSNTRAERHQLTYLFGGK
jgi:hypothetical protein